MMDSRSAKQRIGPERRPETPPRVIPGYPVPHWGPNNRKKARPSAALETPRRADPRQVTHQFDEMTPALGISCCSPSNSAAPDPFPTDSSAVRAPSKLIAGSPVLAIFHGHTHHPWENRIDGIPVFGTGSVTYRRCLHHDYAQGLVLEIHPPQYRVVTIHSDGSVTAPIHEVPLGP